MKKELKEEKGITMVALVVTIVVLLILASITLAALSGDDGIINNAQKAKEETEIAQWEEKIDAAIIDAENKHRDPTLDDVIEELIKDGIIEDESKVDRNTGAITTKEPVHTIEGKLDDYLDKEEPEEPDPEPDDPDNPVVAQYNVTYNYSENGGTSADKKSVKLEEGKSIDLSVKATKEGYTFVGWNTNKDARTGLNSLIMGKKDVTLYAIYSKVVTATFYYYDDGEKSQEESVTLFNKETQGEVSTPQINSVVRDETTYSGRAWSEENVADGNADVSPGKTINISENKNYYALYTGIKRVNMYYYNGSGQDLETDSVTSYMNASGEIKNEAVDIPYEITSSMGPYGTTYKGLASSPNSTASATVNADNTTYYAFYQTEIKYYYNSTSTYSSNRTGTRSSVSDGSSYKNTVDSYIPSSYDGATFSYWSGTSGVDENVSPSLSTYTEYFAVYKREITADFNYYNGYSTDVESANGTRTYISTKEIVTQLQANISIPDKVKDSSGPEGTKYAYVASDVNGTSGSVTPSSEGGTYFAIYTKEITITKRTYYDSYSYQYGTAYGYSNGRTLGATIQLGSAISTSGYSFYGWCTTSSVNATPISNTTIYNVMDDTEYYALYRKSVTVTYNANGGSVYPSSQSAVTYMNYQANTSGGEVTLPTPNWSGYTFLGWYTSSSSGNRVGGGGSTYTPNSNITLYAQWEAEKSYIDVSMPPSLTANTGKIVKFTATMEQKYDFQLYKAETENGTGEAVLGVDYSASTSSGKYRIIFTINNVSYDDEGYYYLVVQTPEGEKESSSRFHLIVN